MRKLIRKCIKLLLIFSIIIASGATALGYFKYKDAISEQPLAEKVSVLRNNQQFKQLEDISPDFLDAIIAIEDHRFYQHGPIDIIALIRATVVNILEGEVVQGGSTLTQQVAKNFYFNSNQSFLRKIAEMFVAHDLEKKYSKDEILEMYVNIIYYGDGNYGIQEASQNYFNKQPNQLSFDEATLLAGLPQSPSSYALSKHYEKAKKRQQAVIKALAKYKEEK